MRMKPALITKKPWSMARVKEHLPDFTINKLWMMLSIMILSLLLLNALQIVLLDTYTAIPIPIAVPACLFAGSLAVIIAWLILNGSEVKDEWRQASGPQRTMWASVLLTLFLPYLLGQFMYMNGVALPAWREKIWTISVEEPAYIPTPAVRLMYWAAEGLDPEIEIKFKCYKKDVGYFACDHLIDPQGYIGHGWHNWYVFPAHKTGSTMGLRYPFILTASIQARKPEYLLSNGTLNPLQVYLWDVKSLRIKTDKYGCGRNKYLQLPWGSTKTVKLGFSQSKFIDKMPSVGETSRTCTSHNLTSYTTYQTTLEPEQSLKNGTKCATGRCDVIIQILPEDLTTQVYLGDRAKDKITMLVEEAGVLGGIAFFTWFLSIYATARAREKHENVDENASDPAASVV